MDEYNKTDQNDKTNYRPISFFPLVSKMLEKVLYQQIKDFAARFYHQNSVDLEKDIQHNMHF